LDEAAGADSSVYQLHVILVLQEKFDLQIFHFKPSQ